MPAPKVYTSKYDNSINPGTIIEAVQVVNASESNITELLPGAIPDSVTHLYLKVLTDRMHIPPSVTHLAVLDFKKEMIAHVPSTVTDLYVHIIDREQGPTDRVLYLFSRCGSGIFEKVQGLEYNLSRSFEDKSFGTMLTVAKLIPKQPIIIVGKTYTELDIADDADVCLIPPTLMDLLRPGSIPTRFTSVNLKNSNICELEPGVLTDSVTHLYLRKLNGSISIPASVKHLAILHYTKDMLQYVPKTVTHLYIHFGDLSQAPNDMTYYLFCAGGFAGLAPDTKDSIYTTGKPYEELSFGYSTTVVKREPTIAHALAVIATLKEENAQLRANS